MRSLAVLVVVAAVVAAACARTSDSTTTLPPRAASGRELPSLVDEYGCGYGFFVGSADQTSRLRLNIGDPEQLDPTDLPQEFELGGAEWTGAIDLGTDLFANWCDDVIEANEPTPVTTETLPILEGTVTILELPPAGECGFARAELSGVVAGGAYGSIELSDRVVTNPTWGCFAG